MARTPTCSFIAPAELIQQLDARSKALGMSRSAYIMEACIAKMKREDEPESVHSVIAPEPDLVIESVEEETAPAELPEIPRTPLPVKKPIKWGTK